MSQPHPFVDRLPIGEPISFKPDGIPGWERFPFVGDLQVKELEPPVIPEPPRRGEGGVDCDGCAEPARNAIWSDENWRVIHLGQPNAVPIAVLLCSLVHCDMDDMPPELSAQLGPMLQRVEKAIKSLGGVARVHVHRGGDNWAHLHFWLVGRPEGMMQLRGGFLMVWDHVLPKAPEQEWRASLSTVAKALAAGGGTAHV